MVCKKCENETKGITLNDRLYCSFCGEVLEEPSTHDNKPGANSFEYGQTEPRRIYEANDSLKNEQKPNAEKIDNTTKIQASGYFSKDDYPNPSPVEDAYNLDLLDAEKEVLDVIEKNEEEKSLLENADFTGFEVIKKNRNRAGMLVVSGEPDPISDPELMPPADLEIESPTGSFMLNETKPEEKALNEPKISADTALENISINEPEANKGDDTIEKKGDAITEVSEAKESNVPKPEIIEEDNLPIKNDPDIKLEEELAVDILGPEPELSDSINKTFESEKAKEGKDSLIAPQDKGTPLPPIREKAHSQKKKNPFKLQKLIFSKKLIAVFLVVFVLIIAFGGLVFYVNNIATNRENIIARIERVSEFGHKRPQYMPAGYEISFESSGTRDSVSYVYYKFDRSNKITVEIRPVSSGFDVLGEVIGPLKTAYTSFNFQGTEIWNVGDRRVVFVSENVLYNISSSDEILKNELTKIAEGIIN